MSEETLRETLADILQRKARLAAITLLTVLSTLVYSCVGKSLWRWFLVPLGLPEIGLAHVYGICVVIEFFAFSLILWFEGKKKSSWYVMSIGILGSLMLLAVGYIAHRLMLL